MHYRTLSLFFLKIVSALKLIWSFKMFQGSDSKTEITNYVEPAFVSDSPIYTIQSQCRPDSSFVVPVKLASINISLGIRSSNIV